MVVGGWWAWVVGVGDGGGWWCAVAGSDGQLDVGGLFPRVSDSSQYYSITVIKYKMIGAGNR